MRRLLNALPILAAAFLATGCPARKADVYRQTPVAVNAPDLAKAFQDEDKGTEKYTGKLLNITGVAVSTGTDSADTQFVQLRGAGDADVQCFFKKSAAEEGARIKKGETVTLRGICASKVIHIAVIECVFPKS